MRRVIFSTLGLVFLLAASGRPVSAKGEITFWTTEVEKDRIEVQRGIARDFTQKTGLGLRVVPVQENRLAQKVTAAYAARSLPDVIFHPIDFTMGWAEAGILDSRSATQIIRSLGPETFGAGPLNLVKTRAGHAAVPIDGWGQLLLYRRDLFQEKGLHVPDGWDCILEAARALHNPPLLWGFEAATDPGQVYTQQVFEHFALSNGARLVGPSGKINLNTPALIETLDFYKALAGFSPPGNLYWLHTRMDYLSGRAAMIVWSPFILDELSGLRRDQPVVPDMAKGKPGFLARNTGFVTVIQGPKGSAQYGQINYLGITRDADKAAAMKWVEYLLSDGYLRWLGLAAEGKLPLRKGTRQAPGRFIKGWKDLEFGVTTRARISGFYGDETVEAIIAGVEGFDRWGFARGKGALMTKAYGTKIVLRVLKRFLDGEISAAEAARMMDQRIKALE